MQEHAEEVKNTHENCKKNFLSIKEKIKCTFQNISEAEVQGSLTKR
jgi:hypothetical protein